MDTSVKCGCLTRKHDEQEPCPNPCQEVRCSGCGVVDVTIFHKTGVSHYRGDEVCGRWEA
jgi:hypothetical protein